MRIILSICIYLTLYLIVICIDNNNENAIDYSYEDDELEKNEQNLKQNQTPNLQFDKPSAATYMWNKWEKWSKCDNSCVQIKRRKCLHSMQNGDFEFFYPSQQRTGCYGVLKKLRLCKEERCRQHKMRHLRDEQCAANTKNTDYQWQGYQHAADECQLHCRALNDTTSIIVNMNTTVLDGTSCHRTAIYYTHGYRQKAVCVQGICKAVHVSGIIRPVTTSDSQMRCGSVLCKLVSDIYNETELGLGSYQFITTLPMGSMNISIRQSSQTNNLLALKSLDDNFIINGESRVSKSGIYEYNGDSFDYNDDVNEIYAKGPLSHALRLMLFVHESTAVVFYEYLLPVASASVSEEEETQTQWNELGQPIDGINERRRRKFSWKLLGFSPCSRSCGAGLRTAIFRCVRDSPTRYFTPKRCAGLKKPTISIEMYQCNEGLCAAYWRVSEIIGDCNCSNSQRQQRVECVQENATGQVEVVADEHCDVTLKPNATAACVCIVPNSKSYVRRHLHNDRLDKTGVWLMSNWQPQCETFAGCALNNYEYRGIYCDRTPPYTNLCDLRYTPQQKRACNRQSADCEAGTWLVSEWSKCSGDCFNLQQQRLVVCLQKGSIVADAACAKGSKKPNNVKNCTHAQVDFCGPKWHYSQWSECSQTCGEGQQRRYAKCLDYDWEQNTLLESSKCAFKEREPVFGTCNMQQCEEFNSISNNETGVANDCNDEFSNCKRINHQRFCKLQYYKTYCCQTCQNYI